MITGYTFMEIAHIIKKNSSCVSLQVGAVLVKDGRIISMGYNGTSAGLKNCNEYEWTGTCPEHSVWSHDNEIHAEMNAITYASKAGLSTEGTILYTTTSPCRQCLKHCKPAGITHIYYDQLYRLTTPAQHRLDQLYCNAQGMGITQLSPNKG